MKIIPLNNGYSCMVDDADYERLNAHRWGIVKSYHQIYARRKSGGKSVLMHREIMNAPAGVAIDHIMDTHQGMMLDNRRSNLRFASLSLNSRNNHRKDVGVWFRKTRNRWVAHAKHKGRVHWVGSYVCKEDAANALEWWKKGVGFKDSEVLTIQPKQPRSITCPTCGVSITTKSPNKKFCSRKCGYKQWELSK